VPVSGAVSSFRVASELTWSVALRVPSPCGQKATFTKQTWSEVSWPPQLLFWLKSAPSLPSMKTLLIETGRSPVF
jgi:hypothetical protein